MGLLRLRCRGRAGVVPRPGAVGCEPIPATRDGLDPARIVGGIRQRRSESIDRRVQALLELNERIVGPQPLAQFVPGDHFSRPLDQHRKNPKRLFLKANLDAALAELPAL